MGLVSVRSVRDFVEQKNAEAIRARRRIEQRAREAAARAARSGSRWAEDAKKRINDETAAYRQLFKRELGRSLPKVTKALASQSGLQGYVPIIGAMVDPKATAHAVINSVKQGAGAVRAGGRGLEDELLQGQANELWAKSRAVIGDGGPGGFEDRYKANLRHEEALDARDRAAHPQARLLGRDMAATTQFAGHVAGLATGQYAPARLSEMDQLLRNRKVEHPDLLPSLVPFAGSAQEAVADYQDGDYLGTAGNAALAVSDALLLGTLVKTGGKAGYKIGGKALSPVWKNVRARMARRGHIAPGQHGHHAIIPQGGVGKYVPDVIKNNPLNITIAKDISTHKRLHGRDLKLGLPKFTLWERVQHGTPTWVPHALGHHVIEAGMTSKRYADRDD